MPQIIHCPQCGHPAAAGQNFCKKCSAPLPQITPGNTQTLTAHTGNTQTLAAHAGNTQTPAAPQAPERSERHFPVLPVLFSLGGLLLIAGIAILVLLVLRGPADDADDAGAVSVETAESVTDDESAAEDPVFNAIPADIQNAQDESSTAADAAPEAAKAAYAEFLAQYPPADLGASFADATYDGTQDYGDYIDYFCLRDITGDDIPELFTVTCPNFRWEIIRVYTFENGAVVPLTDAAGNDAVLDDNHAANGSYDVYFCAEGHVHNAYYGDMGTEETVWGCVDGVWTEIGSCSETKGDYLFAVYMANSEDNLASLRK